MGPGKRATGDGADVLTMPADQEEADILRAAVGRSAAFERVVVEIIRTEPLPIRDEPSSSEVARPVAPRSRMAVPSGGEGGAGRSPGRTRRAARWG